VRNPFIVSVEVEDLKVYKRQTKPDGLSIRTALSATTRLNSSKIPLSADQNQHGIGIIAVKLARRYLHAAGLKACFSGLSGGVASTTLGARKSFPRGRFPIICGAAFGAKVAFAISMVLAVDTPRRFGEDSLSYGLGRRALTGDARRVRILSKSAIK
jgi:hypothetical protein